MAADDGLSVPFITEPGPLALRIGEFFVAVGIDLPLIPHDAVTVYWNSPYVPGGVADYPAVEIDAAYLVAIAAHSYVHFQRNRKDGRWVRRPGPAGRSLVRILHNILIGVTWDRLRAAEDGG